MCVTPVFCAGAAHSALASPFAFATIDFPGSTSTAAFGLNNSGQVVGDYGPGGAIQGFLLSGGTFTTIDFPGTTVTIAEGINSSGQVVGAYVFTMDVPGATLTDAHGINDSGQVVGEYVIIFAWSWRGRRQTGQ
jgi:uncharacterized membrane protein